MVLDCCREESFTTSLMTTVFKMTICTTALQSAVRPIHVPGRTQNMRHSSTGRLNAQAWIRISWDSNNAMGYNGAVCSIGMVMDW